MAPLTGLLPSSAVAYIAKAFITVITGGAGVVAGTPATLGLFGTVDQIVSFALDAGDRRNRDAGAGDRPAAPDAARRDRPVLPELDMTGADVRHRPYPLGLASSRLPCVLAALPLVTKPTRRRCSLIWALFALSLGLMWGFAGILSFGHAAYFGLGALHLRDRLLQDRREHRCRCCSRSSCRRGCGHHRRDDVLWPHQRRLSRRDHAGRHADPVQVHERDCRRRLQDRQRAARRLQRHTGVSDPERARRSEHRRSTARTYYYVVIAACSLCLLLCALDPRRRLRPDADRHPRERSADGAARLQRAAYKTAIFAICGAMAGLAGCLFANWAEIVTPERVQPRHQRPRCSSGSSSAASAR